MTRDQDRKRIIRARMRKTGESYTTARSHVISTSTEKPRAPIDYAALAGTRDDAVVAKTGRRWPEWVRVLDADGAASMPHGKIATLVHTKYGVDGWWAQTITVGYERIKGLRDRGQRRGGAYEVSKSRTFAVPVATLFRAWADEGTRRRWLDGLTTRVRTATAAKSMRLQWPDGTIVAVWFTAKGDRKSAVAVQHTKLADRAAADAAKRDWGRRFDTLASVLTGER